MHPHPPALAHDRAAFCCACPNTSSRPAEVMMIIIIIITCALSVGAFVLRTHELHIQTRALQSIAAGVSARHVWFSLHLDYAVHVVHVLCDFIE